jgi:uncharacterized delta-60 repeat protein
MRSRIILFLLYVLLLSKSYGQEGLLDSSFGDHGKVLTSFTSGSDITATIIQPDGKILVDGKAFITDRYELAVSRYHYNGTLDSTFGTNGTSLVYFNGSAYGNCMALQADGKIIIGGYFFGFNKNDFALARLLPNGAPDVVFGNSGTVITPFSNSNNEISGIAVKADGSIVAVGYSTEDGAIHTFALAQYTSNGAPDIAFGNAGKITTNFDGGLAYAKSITFQTDGKYLVAGYAASNLDFDYDFAAARYKTDGSLDSTFGINGKLITSFGNTDQVTGIVLQPDNKIILSGSSFNSSGMSDIAIARYQVNGQLDSSFGSNGKTLDATLPDIAANGIILRPDGKLVVAGSEYESNVESFLVSQYLSNGAVDSFFGTNGKTLTTFGSHYDQAKAIALQQDGKIIAAGVGGEVANGTLNIALTRYNAPFGQVCPNGGISFHAGVTGSAYQWQANSGSGYININNDINYSGTNTAMITLANIPSSSYGYQYRCVVDGSGNSSIYTLQIINKWIGNTVFWESSSNWSCGAVPDSNTDVIISGGNVIINSNVAIRSLVLSSNATLTVNKGNTLTILH